MKTVTAWWCGVVLALAGGVVDVSARPRTFVAADGVRMKTDVPAGYSFETDTTQDGQLYIRMENPVWPIFVAVVFAPESLVPAKTEEEQRNLLVTQAAEILAQSKEQDYHFLPLNPVSGSGVYCVFSEPGSRKPEDLKPNEFLHIVAGVKTVRGVVMYFRIMCNDITTPEYQEIFDLFVNEFDRA